MMLGMSYAMGTWERQSPIFKQQTECMRGLTQFITHVVQDTMCIIIIHIVTMALHQGRRLRLGSPQARLSPRPGNPKSSTLNHRRWSLHNPWCMRRCTQEKDIAAFGVALFSRVSPA